MAIWQLLPQTQTKQEVVVWVPAATAGSSWGSWRFSCCVAMPALPDTKNAPMENRTHGTQNSVQCLWSEIQVWQTSTRVQTCFQPSLHSSQAFQFPQKSSGNAAAKGTDGSIKPKAHYIQTPQLLRQSQNASIESCIDIPHFATQKKERQTDQTDRWETNQNIIPKRKKKNRISHNLNTECQTRGQTKQRRGSSRRRICDQRVFVCLLL